MRNRRGLFALLAVAALAVSTVGSGAFTTTSADRGVTVDVVGDENAYMALEYPVDRNLEPGQPAVFLTVRNQFAEPDVRMTVVPSITADDGVSVGVTEPDMALGVGDELEATVTATCEPKAAGEQSVTVSFDVTAEGDAVFAETKTARTVVYTVDCGEPVGVKFPGQNAQVRNADRLDDTGATIWTLENSTLHSTDTSLSNNGPVSTIPAQGQGTIVAVYLTGTDTTYVHPGLERTNGTFGIENPGEGSSAVTDRTCDGNVPISSQDELPC